MEKRGRAAPGVAGGDPGPLRRTVGASRIGPGLELEPKTSEFVPETRVPIPGVPEAVVGRPRLLEV